MNTVDISDMNIPMVFYKICREIEKAHMNGIIHDDVKMGNILVVLDDEDSYSAQVIDWNLATFYYPGYSSPLRKGTFGYFAP